MYATSSRTREAIGRRRCDKQGTHSQQNRLGRQHEQVEHGQIAEAVPVTLREAVRVGVERAVERRGVLEVDRDPRGQRIVGFVGCAPAGVLRAR